MNSIAPTANQNNPATEPNFATIGATVNTLLDQVPEPLRNDLDAAITADRIAMYGNGLRHGRTNAFNAVEKFISTSKTACRPWCVDHIETTADGDICTGQTVQLNFDTTAGPAGNIDSVSLGLSYSADEGEAAFMHFAGPDRFTANMTAADLRTLATAALKLVGGSR